MADNSDKKHDPEAMNVDEEEEEKKTDLTDTIISLTRIRRIVKSDPDTKQISSDAVFLIAKATELFLDQVAKLAYQEATSDKKKKTLQYNHLAKVVRMVEELEFLHDIIPEQTPLHASA